MIIKRTSITNEAKLQDLMNYTESVGDCNLWKGALNSDGYPTMLGNVKVHRLVYKLSTGENIDGLVVRHTCDNPLCIKPKHLLSGTPADNHKDMVDRNRKFRVINKEVVVKVKALLASGVLMQKEIANIVGIDQRRVSDINRGKYGDDGRLVYPK